MSYPESLSSQREHHRKIFLLDVLKFQFSVESCIRQSPGEVLYPTKSMQGPISHEVHAGSWIPRSPGGALYPTQSMWGPESCGSSIGVQLLRDIELDRAYVGPSNVSVQARIGGRPDGLWTLAKLGVFLFDRPASLAGKVVWSFASTLSQSVKSFCCSLHFTLSLLWSDR